MFLYCKIDRYKMDAKQQKVYFVLPSRINTETIRGTEQFILETAAYLNKYMDVMVFEPEYTNINNVKNSVLKCSSKYLQIKSGLLKSVPLKANIALTIAFTSLPILPWCAS